MPECNETNGPWKKNTIEPYAVVPWGKINNGTVGFCARSDNLCFVNSFPFGVTRSTGMNSKTKNIYDQKKYFLFYPMPERPKIGEHFE